MTQQIHRPDRSRLTGCYVLAMVVAPFAALIFGINAALLVLTLALSFTAYLVILAGRTMGPAARGRLFATAALNGILAVICALVLVIRLI